MCLSVWCVCLRVCVSVCLYHKKLRTYVRSIIIISLLNWYVHTHVRARTIMFYCTVRYGTVLVNAWSQILVFSTEESTTDLVHGARFQLHQVETELFRHTNYWFFYSSTDSGLISKSIPLQILLGSSWFPNSHFTTKSFSFLWKNYSEYHFFLHFCFHCYGIIDKKNSDMTAQVGIFVSVAWKMALHSVLYSWYYQLFLWFLFHDNDQSFLKFNLSSLFFITEVGSLPVVYGCFYLHQTMIFLLSCVAHYHNSKIIVQCMKILHRKRDSKNSSMKAKKNDKLYKVKNRYVGTKNPGEFVVGFISKYIMRSKTLQCFYERD